MIKQFGFFCGILVVSLWGNLAFADLDTELEKLKNPQGEDLESLQSALKAVAPHIYKEEVFSTILNLLWNESYFGRASAAERQDPSKFNVYDPKSKTQEFRDLLAKPVHYIIDQGEHFEIFETIWIEKSAQILSKLEHGVHLETELGILVGTPATENRSNLVRHMERWYFPFMEDYLTKATDRIISSVDLELWKSYVDFCHFWGHIPSGKLLSRFPKSFLTDLQFSNSRLRWLDYNHPLVLLRLFPETDLNTVPNREEFLSNYISSFDKRSAKDLHFATVMFLEHFITPNTPLREYEVFSLVDLLEGIQDFSNPEMGRQINVHDWLRNSKIDAVSRLFSWRFITYKFSEDISNELVSDFVKILNKINQISDETSRGLHAFAVLPVIEVVMGRVNKRKVAYRHQINLIQELQKLGKQPFLPVDEYDKYVSSILENFSLIKRCRAYFGRSG